MSVQYLIPAQVIEYIEENDLYREDGTSSVDGKGKRIGTDSSGRASPAAAGGSATKS
jgi:nicotinamide mononucleotide adenylyltransferase